MCATKVENYSELIDQDIASVSKVNAFQSVILNKLLKLLNYYRNIIYQFIFYTMLW